MGGISILLILSFLLFFILTRCVWIYVIKDDVLKIELHLPILALSFDFSDKNKKGKKKKANQKSGFKLFKLIIDRIEMCSVHIKSISLPKGEYSGTSYFTRPYTYTAVLYGAIALLASKAGKVKIDDNAVIFSDTKKFKCNITVYTKLYYLIISAFAMYLNLKRENKKEAIYDR